MRRHPCSLPLLPADSLESPEAMTGPHQHGHIELNFLESGSFILLRQGELVTVEAGALVLFWAAMPHWVLRLEQARGFHYIHVAFTEFRRWSLPTALTSKVIGGGLLLSTRESPGNVHSMRQWVNDLNASAPERRALALDEIQVKLRRLSLEEDWTIRQDGVIRTGPIKPGPEAGAHLAMDKVARMSAYITRHSAEPVRLAEIAQSAGMHPASAGMLFKRVLGCTPIEMLTQQRLAHAQQLLMTGDATVLTVALDCGFATPSRFYAAFTQAFGITPAAYRRQMLGDVKSAARSQI